MAKEAALSDYLDLSSRTSTFVSIDVAGSTKMKTGQNEQDIIYTFLAYHKLVSELAYANHGEVFNIMGDGILCRFQRADDAEKLAQDLLGDLVSFNKKQNRLTQSLSLRVGVHTGEVLESQAMASGQVFSKTIDLAAKLQQSAQPDHVRFSEATVSLLQDHGQKLRRIGWDTALGMNVFDYAPHGGASADGQRRKMPDPCRVLLVEQDLEEIAKLRKSLFGARRDVFAAFNHNQAALALSAWLPHLAVISVDLPWGTGWEFLTSLRSEARFTGMPIIVMCRQTTGEVIQKSFQMGANGFLKKPLDEQQVVKRVETVMREFYL
jgi:class 3 adenylate cyclase/CheY-like chemotaxis protein